MDLTFDDMYGLYSSVTNLKKTGVIRRLWHHTAVKQQQYGTFPTSVMPPHKNTTHCSKSAALLPHFGIEAALKLHWSKAAALTSILQ
jgi:hypothetical protein